jgi:hypothetical protein
LKINPTKKEVVVEEAPPMT